MTVYDHRRCELGEGPLWHPLRGELFWFDILEGRLHSRGPEGETSRDLGEMASAAGWVDRDRLLVASETTLSVLHLGTGAREAAAALIEPGSGLRSNDGRADPWGGFWIGTMGKQAEPGAGAILRYHRGALRRLREGVTIPNAICFDRARALAYFSDSRAKTVWRQRLDPDSGWPVAEAEVFLDLTGESFGPDGAVVDAEGRFWNAHWGAGRVACYDPSGRMVMEERFDATRTSCPAFGGEAFDLLHVTSAQEGMSPEARAAEPHAGKTFVRKVAARGVAEPAVILG